MNRTAEGEEGERERGSAWWVLLLVRNATYWQGLSALASKCECFLLKPNTKSKIRVAGTKEGLHTMRERMEYDRTCLSAIIYLKTECRFLLIHHTFNWKAIFPKKEAMQCRVGKPDSSYSIPLSFFKLSLHSNSMFMCLTTVQRTTI